MSIASTTRKAGPFTGNGSTTVFPFTFKVFQASDLVVTQTSTGGTDTSLILTTDYTVSLNANQDSNPGGSITTAYAIASGYLLTITSNVPELQPVVLTNMGGFYPSVINDALDRLTIYCQQLSEQVSRAIKLSVSSSQTADQLLATILAEATATQAAYTSFVGTYYGALGADPSLDPLGNAISQGDIYFSLPMQVMRVYTSTGWQNTAAATPVGYNSQLFNGNGSTTAFTLSSTPAALLATEVFVSGVRQRPTTDYNLTGTTLTFVSAPATGTNNIFVRWTNSIAIGVPNDGSVLTSSIQDLAVTTAKIANAAITYAKMQNVSATQRLLGRNSAGAGSPEEITLSQLLDWIGSATQGDILYRDASGWARLAAGTSGSVLTTNGPAANPSWAAASGSGLGSGQTWQDVTASRVSGTTYTNSTGKPIMCVFSLFASGVSSTLSRSVTVAGVSIVNYTGSGGLMTTTVVVPNGSTYSFTCTAAGGTGPTASFVVTELR